MNPELPLRDIQSADPAAFWPPAFGWWALAIVFLALLAWAIWQAFRRARREAERGRLRGDVARALLDGDDNYLEAASTCLRRLLVRYGGMQDHTATIGDAWAQLLASPDPQRFRNVANDIAKGAYRPRQTTNRELIRELAFRWIDQLVEQRHA